MIFTEEEDKERFELFQKIMIGCSENFLKQAGHFFYNEAKLRLAMMPWDETDPCLQMMVKTGVKATKHSDMVDTSSKTIVGVGKTKTSGGGLMAADEWVALDSCPVVKTKAYDPVSLKLLVGYKILFSPKKGMKNVEAIILTFTKLFIKVKRLDTGAEGKIKYSQVLGISKAHVKG